MFNVHTSAKSIFIAVSLITAPIGANAATITTGNLSYNDITEVITNTNGLHYLGWSVAASLNHAETVAATTTGGIYEDFHIASQTEAYAFYNDALNNEVLVDHVGYQYHRSQLKNNQNHRFGNNFNLNSAFDIAWFLSDEAGYGGSLNEVGYLYSDVSNLYMVDRWSTIATSDFYSANNNRVTSHISWLLVSDEQVSQVPVPAAIWLMGSALLGLTGISKRKKITRT